MSQLKILMAIGNLSKGGAEHQCCLLANNLQPDRYRVGIMYFHEGPNPDLEDHVQLLSVARGNKWDLIGLYKRIDDAAKAFAPDIVHAWLPEVMSVPVAAWASKRKVPSITSHRISLKYSGSCLKVLRDNLGLLAHAYSHCVVSNYDVKEEP